MSFWRFGFAAPSSIETLLNPTSPVSIGGAGTSTPLHPAATLDKLLEEDDLLQEVKAQNLKLVDFLGRREVVARLLGYISGEVFDAEDKGKEEQRRIFNGAAGLAGEGDDGAVDDADSMLMSVLDPDESPSTERRRARNPYLSTEILASNLHTVTDTLFSADEDLLGPFWDHVLDQPPEVLRKKSVQLGHWSRANGVLINTKQTEMLTFVKSRPRLVERLLLHFAASPIVDVTFRLVQCEEHPSGEGTLEWFANEHLVPRLVAMLGPEHPPEMHATVAEFLRNVTTFCTSPHVHPLDQSADQPPAPPVATTKGEAPAPPPTVHDDARLRFISNRLMRELTGEDTISLLMSFAIDSCPLPETDPSFFQPKSSAPAVAPLYPAPPTPEGVEQTLPNAASATSSLIHCLAVVADLIRRNNSDFVERQILDFYRREPTYPDRPPAVVDLGPLLSVVQTRLGALQSLIRYPRTLANGADTISTTFGTIEPLTLERFRIIELYGELLHCSNMGMLNRPENKEPFYDDEGVLIGGQASADVLAAALEPPKDDVDEAGPAEGKKSSFSALPSPELTPPNRSAMGSPAFSPSNHAASIARAMALASSPVLSGNSSPTNSETMTETPSELDSETGVLTKEEAMQLQGIIAESRLAEDDDEKEADLGPAIGLDEGKGKGKGRQEEDGMSSRRPSVPVINYTIDSRGINKRKAFPGDQLKACFRKHQVLETAVDLFFTHPWNSFLHSVIYDLVQQVLGARMDQGGNLMLARTLLVKAAVVEKIIQGDALNTEYTSMKNKSRMGYMGHMILMAEQVSKALMSFPRRLAEPASRAGAIPQPGWDAFLSRSVRPMQDSAGKPLGGGVPIVLPETASEKGGSSSSSSEGDDEEAAAGWGGTVGRKLERGMPGGGSEEAGAERMRKAVVAGGASGDGKSDEFARYLVSQIQGRGDRFSSDDSDSDDDAPAVGTTAGHGGWAGQSGFGTKVGGATGEGKFGFDDRFDSDGRVHSSTRRRSSFDDDDGFADDFGPFSDAAVASDPFADDHFAPPSPSRPSAAGKKKHKKKGPPPAVPTRKNLTVADWNADFKKAVDQGSSHDIDAAFGKVRLQEAESKGTGDEDDEDDNFGDFLTARPGSGSLQDSWTDFDIGKTDEFSPPTSPGGGVFASRTNPLLAASPPRSSSSSSSSVASSRVAPPGAVNGARRMRRRSSSASAASSEDEPLGPGVAKGAKIRRDGKVEAEVDGRKVTVPSDDVALASFEAHSHGGGV